VVEVGRGLQNQRLIEKYPLTYWQHAKNWCDALKLASTDHQPSGSVENHLQSLNMSLMHFVYRPIEQNHPQQSLEGTKEHITLP